MINDWPPQGYRNLEANEIIAPGDIFRDDNIIYPAHGSIGSTIENSWKPSADWARPITLKTIIRVTRKADKYSCFITKTKINFISQNDACFVVIVEGAEAEYVFTKDKYDTTELHKYYEELQTQHGQN